MNRLLGATVVGAGALAALPASGQTAEWCGSGLGWMGGMMSGGLSMILFWGAVIAVIVMAVRGRRWPQSDAGHQAHNILRERFARGEIGADEYQERKKLLGD